MKLKIQNFSRLLIISILMLTIGFFFSTDASAATKVTQKKVTQKYDSYTPFRDGLSIVKKNDKYGVINTNGKEILGCYYSSIQISEHIIRAQKSLNGQGTLYGIFDKKGKTIVDFGKYDSIQYYPTDADDNYHIRGAYVYENNKLGLLNNKGKVIIAPGQYQWWGLQSRSFEEPILIEVENDNKYGLLTMDGKRIFDFIYDSLDISCTNTYAVIKTPLNYPEYDYCVITPTGKTIVKWGEYTKIESLSPSLIYVEKDDLAGIISSTGKVIAALGTIDTYASSFSSRGVVLVKSDGESYYINDSGKTVFKANDYDSFSTFSNGVSVVKKDGKSGVIDNKGTIIVPLGKYEIITTASDGIMKVTKNNKIGIITTSGKEIVKLGKYEYISTFYNGLAEVTKKDKHGIINSAGKEIVKLGKYNFCTNLKNGLIKVTTSNHEFGILNKNGKVIIKPGKYLSIEPKFNGKLLLVGTAYKSAAKYGLVDLKGKQLTKLIYDDPYVTSDDEYDVFSGGIYAKKGKDLYILSIK